VSVEEMDKALIKTWRDCVGSKDTIINLGDVFMGSYPKERRMELLKNLPGYKILVLGNHDKNHSAAYWREIGFDEVYPYPIIFRNWFILSHEPLFMNDRIPYVNIHGHTHDKSYRHASYLNVSVDNTEFAPISFESLTAGRMFPEQCPGESPDTQEVPPVTHV
jgi:calcineurin-like phosphoesterase family protein